MKTLIDTLLRQALAALPGELLPPNLHEVFAAIEVERTRDAKHGDFATNLAMQLANTTRQNPRKIAGALLAGVRPRSNTAMLS